MSVTRSALASSAARSHCVGSRADPAGDVARRAAQPRRRASRLRAELVVIDDARELRQRATRAASCGPGRRRTARRRAARAARVRCRSTIARGIARLEVAHDEEAVRAACPRRRRARSTSGSAASSGSGTPAARRGSRIERAGVDHRPFDERGHLVEQRVGHDHRSRLRACRRAGGRSRRGARRTTAMTLPSARASARRRRRSRSRCRARPRKRWPSVMRPAARPSAVTGTTSAPCSARSRCAGRTNSTSL